MSPRGVYARTGAKNSGGGDAAADDTTDRKHLIALPPHIEARVQRAAAADDRRVAVYLRRFIITNIDIIDPPEAD
jgi:hypothetical protein